MRKPGQFRDKTALEVLTEGENEAMEGSGGAALAMSRVAGTIDARFEAIEKRLTALEHPWSPDTAARPPSQRRTAAEDHEGAK